MLKILLVLAMVAVVSAGLVPGQERGTWVEGEVTTVHQMPSIPVPGKGADALFIFAAYSNVAGFAWGRIYWNPTDNQFPTIWSYDTVNPSTVLPDGSPYHWNGGMGTALDNLGYTWEWYPTWDNEDAMQVFPDVVTLQDYDVVFVHTFDNWWGPPAAISDANVTILSDYMDAGGIVVLVGQDLHWGGLADVFLDGYFACGTVTDDVINGDVTVPATGITGTFAAGWAGTADKLNFTDSNGFYTDAITTNGWVTGASGDYASYKDVTKCIYSTFEFETCNEAEVQAIASMIMTYVNAGGALQQSTWGSIKSDF